MKTKNELSITMVPALESASGKPSIGDIGSVPAVRVELHYLDQFIRCLGIIDSGADISVLDKSLCNWLTQTKSGVEGTMTLGIEGKVFSRIYYVGLKILGEEKGQELSFAHVPVTVLPLPRRMLIIGRRGVLEWLRIDLDFPRRRAKLVLSQRLVSGYPALSQTCPSLKMVIESFQAALFTHGIMMITWDLERFLDKVIAEDQNLRTSVYSKPPGAMTFGNKLTIVLRAKRATDLYSEARELIKLRNTAAHAFTDILDSSSAQKVLATAELIVSRLM